MNQSPLLWSNILLTLDSVKTIGSLEVPLAAPFCLLACMAGLEISYNVEGKTLYLPELFLPLRVTSLVSLFRLIPLFHLIPCRFLPDKT